MRIGLVTCAVLPEPDPDAAPLEDALRRRGHDATWVPWDDDTFKLDGFDLFVMRSAWNYHAAPSAFLEWVARAHAHAKVINPPEVIAWNAHKGYLCTLAAAGTPIVPTQIVAADELADMAIDHAVVIKPAIGAGSVGARQFLPTQGDAARAHAAALALNGDVIVQPYLEGFCDPGERSLVCIAGTWTHAIRKHPRFADQVERVDGGEPPTPAELDVARTAVAAIPWPVAYARADLVLHDGHPVVSELELIEPSLFFDHGPGSVERFVDMIERSA